MRRIEWVCIHTAGAYDYASKRVAYQSTQTIREYHRAHNGWHDIGYHWVIEDDGKLMPGRAENVIGAHAGGFNEHSIGICVTGHGDFAPFTPAQLGELIRLCARICFEHRFPGIRVIGHRETAQHGGPPVSKTCPGVMVDMNEIRRLVADRIDGDAA